MNEYLISQIPLIVGIFSLLVIAPISSRFKDLGSLLIALLALTGTLILTAMLPEKSRYFGGAVLITGTGKSLALLSLFFVITAIALTEGYLEKIHVPIPEWRLTVLFVTLGIINLCFAEDLATVFVSFELLSIPSYALVGFSRHDGRSNEAGIKYLILGILGSAFFLLGITFVYGASGQIFLSGIREDLAAALAMSGTDVRIQSEIDLYRIALGAFLIALFFKTAVAPFHGWLLDVYKGGSYAALSIVAVPAKIAGFGLIFRLLHGPFEPLRETWTTVLALAAVVCFLVGGLQGIRQDNVKRILACSSILNAGFILLSMLGDGKQFVYYLAVYSAATIGVIAVLMAYGTTGADVDEVEDIIGVARKHPVTAVGFTILLFSSAGVPMTAGFLAKLGVFYGMFQNPERLPIIAGITGALCSVMAFYYYFRLIRTVWFEPETTPTSRSLRTNYVGIATLLACLLLIGGLAPGLSSFF